RYRTLLLGLFVGLYLPALVHTLREVTGVGQMKWIIHLNAAPVLFYAVCTGWALLRQNVLRADDTTTIVVSYAATLLTLGLGCGGAAPRPGGRRRAPAGGAGRGPRGGGARGGAALSKAQGGDRPALPARPRLRRAHHRRDERGHARRAGGPARRGDRPRRRR